MRQIIITMLTLLFLTLASCMDDEDLAMRDCGDAVVFYIDQASSRATNTTFEAGDEIGVYAHESSGTLKSSGNYADNVRYRYDGVKFTAVGAPILTSSTKALSYDIYYPYQAVTDARALDFTVKTDQSAGTSSSDLLYSHKNAEEGATGITLVFTHLLSKVTVPLSLLSYTDYSSVSCTMKDVATTVRLNLSDGSVSLLSPKSDVRMSRSGSDYTLIMPAQQLATGTPFMRVDYGTDNYTFQRRRNYEFQKGRKYVCPMELRQTSAPVSTCTALSVTPSSINATAAGGTYNYSVTATLSTVTTTRLLENDVEVSSTPSSPVITNENVTASAVPSKLMGPSTWSITPGSLTVTANTGASAVFGQYSLSYMGKSATLNVTQAAGGGIIVEPEK